MKLRHRAMQPQDVGECVDIVASHPVIGPRYGPDIGLLSEAWRCLLDYEPHFAAVFYADEGLRPPICFLGVTVAVHDDFISEIKALPQFWVGPELARRFASGKSPLLTNNQFRDANSRDGLNLLCWEGFVRGGYEAHSELHRCVMAEFIRMHQGYLWKEIIANQAESAARLNFFLRTGAALWDPVAGCYISEPKSDPGEIVRRPHILGKTRDLERTGSGDWAGSWVGALFDYQAPVLGLNRSEQRLLSSALFGMTDEHLASLLETSLPAVKKTWVSIYRRVEEFLPELIPDPSGPGFPASGRGKEKRRGLLAYVREHPEELRPVSRKLGLERRDSTRDQSTVG